MGIDVDTQEGKALLSLTNYGTTLACPTCGHDYTHMDLITVTAASGQSVTVLARGEDEESEVIVATGAVPPLRDTRRHVIVLRISCENGCENDLSFQQYKGYTFAGVEQVERPAG